jgi:hypothetical protein
MAIVKEEIVGTLIKNNIKSSNLKNTIYDTVNKTLLVTFNNDHVYEYYDVPHSEYTKFRMSESQGQYFSKNIAKKYKYAKK